jgi:SAM-dependent methyltransferase
VGSSILHHLRPAVALEEVFRVLRPDGFIAFAEPNMLNPQIAIQKNIPVIKRWLGDSPEERAFFRWQATKLLENAGFDRIAVTPYDFLHLYAAAFDTPDQCGRQGAIAAVLA